MKCGYEFSHVHTKISITSPFHQKFTQQGMFKVQKNYPNTELENTNYKIDILNRRNLKNIHFSVSGTKMSRNKFTLTKLKRMFLLAVSWPASTQEHLIHEGKVIQKKR